MYGCGWLYEIGIVAKGISTLSIYLYRVDMFVLGYAFSRLASRNSTFLIQPVICNEVTHVGEIIAPNVTRFIPRNGTDVHLTRRERRPKDADSCS